MKSGSSGKIRVDQSHCNYYLAQWLRDRGWGILFTDAGRVSRGGTGAQGECLRIFEEAALPIPDIVAVRDGCLLFIEIDSTLSKAKRSLEIYRLQEGYILSMINSRLAPNPLVISMITGFCRTGIIRNSESFFTTAKIQMGDVDLWVTFEQPRTPLCYWVKTDHVEK